MRLHAGFLQELQGDGRTGFGICEGLVVLCQCVSAALGYGGQTMIAEVSQLVACCLERAEERVVGVVHSVHPEYRLEATFIERLVVCHERKPCDQRFHFGPHVRKDPRRLGVGCGQSVYACIVVVVIVRFGTNQAVITVYDLTTSYNDDAHAADTRPLGIGRLKVYGSKVSHYLAELVIISMIFIMLPVKNFTEMASSITPKNLRRIYTPPFPKKRSNWFR